MLMLEPQGEIIEQAPRAPGITAGVGLIRRHADRGAKSFGQRLGDIGPFVLHQRLAPSSRAQAGALVAAVPGVPGQATLPKLATARSTTTNIGQNRDATKQRTSVCFRVFLCFPGAVSSRGLAGEFFDRNA
jgi:hypothetical protein